MFLSRTLFTHHFIKRTVIYRPRLAVIAKENAWYTSKPMSRLLSISKYSYNRAKENDYEPCRYSNYHKENEEVDYRY